MIKDIEIGKLVKVKTKGGISQIQAPPLEFIGILEDRNNKYFKGGCIELKYMGMQAVLSSRENNQGKVLGFVPGEKVMSIPLLNIESMETIKRSYVSK